MDLNRGKNKRLNKWIDVLALAIFFIIGLIFIFLFLYIHNYQEVREYINKVNSNNTTAGLRLIVIYGIAKLFSIILGLLIPIAVIYKIIQEIRNGKSAYNK